MNDQAAMLVKLGMRDDDQLREVLAYHLLTSNRDDTVTEAFRHESMRRRTLKALGRLLVMADKMDRAGQKPEVRRNWQAIRAAARAEKVTITALPVPVDAAATPRRRALQRLALEYPDDWAQVLNAGGGNPAKVSLRNLPAADGHKLVGRFLELVREERGF